MRSGAGAHGNHILEGGNKPTRKESVLISDSSNLTAPIAACFNPSDYNDHWLVLVHSNTFLWVWLFL